MTDPTADQLYVALIDCRDAAAAAMRVIYRFNTLNTAFGGVDGEMLTAFIDEIHAAGVTDGFGKRADDLIRAYGAKAESGQRHDASTASTI